MNNTPLRAPMALGFILAVPLFAMPALGGSAPALMHTHARHHVANFTRAEALVSPRAPARRVPEADGLSRNDEDCNFGCIDH